MEANPRVSASEPTVVTTPGIVYDLHSKSDNFVSMPGIVSDNGAGNRINTAMMMNDGVKLIPAPDSSAMLLNSGADFSKLSSDFANLESGYATTGLLGAGCLKSGAAGMQPAGAFNPQQADA